MASSRTNFNIYIKKAQIQSGRIRNFERQLGYQNILIVMIVMMLCVSFLIKICKCIMQKCQSGRRSGSRVARHSAHRTEYDRGEDDDAAPQPNPLRVINNPRSRKAMKQRIIACLEHTNYSSQMAE